MPQHVTVVNCTSYFNLQVREESSYRFQESLDYLARNVSKLLFNPEGFIKFFWQ